MYIMKIVNIPSPFKNPSRLLPIFLLLTFQFTSKGQNFMMSENQTGLHAGAEIAFNSFENFYAIYPGYTLNGRLTFGFGLGKNKDIVNKINSTFLRPYVSYLLIKQSPDNSPVSIDLNLGYQYNYVQQLIFNTSSVLFGTGIYHEIAPLGDVKIIPAVLCEGRKETSGPNTQFRENIVLSYGAQTSLIWNNYNLTPQVMISESVVTISATLGMFFSSQYD